MLKVRVIPTLLFKDHGLVKGVGFNSWRRVGTALPAIKVYNAREVDELVFLNIAANRTNEPLDLDTIDQLADECSMPFTVGGGIRSVDDVRDVLRAGADKVVINTAAVESPTLISDVAGRFGSQCVTISIDVRARPGGKCEVYTHSGTQATGLEVVTWAKKAVALGAGEILLTSIDRDGTMQGYDVTLIRSVTEAVSIPVIASGGAGSFEHLAEAVTNGGAMAVAAASLFHFTEKTPLGAKHFLQRQGIAVRL